jgi:hypothetical protein
LRFSVLQSVLIDSEALEFLGSGALGLWVLAVLSPVVTWPGQKLLA